MASSYFRKKMKLKPILGWSSALFLSAIMAQAQETNDVEKINQQLKQLQQSFEKQQREMKENFDHMLREQQQQIEALKKQLEATKTNVPPAAATSEQMEELNQKVNQVVEAQ